MLRSMRIRNSLYEYKRFFSFLSIVSIMKIPGLIKSIDCEESLDSGNDDVTVFNISHMICNRPADMMLKFFPFSLSSSPSNAMYSYGFLYCSCCCSFSNDSTITMSLLLLIVSESSVCTLLICEPRENVTKLLSLRLLIKSSLLSLFSLIKRGFVSMTRKLLLLLLLLLCFFLNSFLNELSLTFSKS